MGMLVHVEKRQVIYSNNLSFEIDKDADSRSTLNSDYIIGGL